ncbi:prepilin-type N-terminal cleavage/methylation domain-containing protein [Pseudidiomarina sp. CB1]|uniref:prepilin-type N-terminal cleavage/methylation domain-containing protein n=1 Tax=Pseudidiomarina sp. CB1 TaxID=2972484 RepID=UPI002161B5F7|nr:prepilin-type N-terminal cleavage/methylation domain-containing protein [Pseudidiomarina sp. CB1]
MGRKTQRAFTLVETLIAMVLLSLLMLGGALAYDYFTQNWQRNKGSMNDAMQRHHLTTLVQRVTQSTFPKVIYKDRRAQQLAFYFLGRDEGFTAVSSASVQDPALPAVYRIFREQKSNGKWRLVYEEAPLDGVPLEEADQTLPFNFRRVLYDDLEALDFSYFGWNNYDERRAMISAENTEELEPAWYTTYDGLQRVAHPLAIAINMNGMRWLIHVPDESMGVLAGYTSDV